MKRRALLSVSDKTGVVEFARGLVAREFEIISTGGTAKVLVEAGIPVTPVQDVTGFPEMMHGRVKTMHPLIMGGILGRPDNENDRAAMVAHGILGFQIVAVNLYPFAKTAADPTKSFDDLIDNIDIGGPTMIRAAVKNFERVLVVTDPDDYQLVLDVLDLTDGPSMGFRFRLAFKAIVTTGEYDAAIGLEFMENVQVVDGKCVRALFQ